MKRIVNIIINVLIICILFTVPVLAVRCLGSITLDITGAPMEKGPVLAFACSILFCGAVNVALMFTDLTAGKKDSQEREKGDNGE